MNRADRKTHGSRRATRVVRSVTAVAVAATSLVVAMPSAQADKVITVIAHRGDRDDAPENTIAAFEKAIDKGTNVIEMDVQYTSSGYPVVMHDSTLDRTTNCSGAVSSKSRTQLERCDAGGWFSSKFDDEPVPTLAAALAAVSDRSSWVQVVVHMKVVPNSTLARRTMDEVRRYGMTSRTIFLASDAKTLNTMRSAGAKHFAYIFNTAEGWNKNFDIMVPYNVKLDAGEVRAAHRRGAVVWPVENNPATLKTLLDKGLADGIMADHLDDLLAMLSPSISPKAAAAADKHSREDDHDDDWADELTRPRG